MNYQQPTIIGFDTETREGPPITVQFFSQHLPRINTCIFVNEENVLEKSLQHLKKHCKQGHYVLYGHNLKFDLTSMFWPVRDQLVNRRGAFEMSHRDWHISGVYGQPTFCFLTGDDVEIAIVDGFSWFRCSLAKASALICPELPKLDMPDGLGTKQFTRRDKGFIEYAMRDAEVSCRVGHAIDDMHAEFELRQTVSVADMASRIFSQAYIQDPIHNVGPRILEAAVKSYHGGKNNVIPDAAPAWHYPVDALDISSAYPHAMTLLPGFSKPNLFAASRVFSRRTRQVPDCGIYCVSGKVPNCNWPVLFDHSFKPIRGAFENIWVSGYELNEALRADEVKLTSLHGHIYDAEKDPVQETALQRFVFDFYGRKSTATDPVRRFLYKVVLNSISGKFIQSREVENDDGKLVWKHGPLYHPFIASLITGHTRAVIHRLEHHVQAMHTSTDGVIHGSTRRPVSIDYAPATGLGAITAEVKDAELCLLRNKCYVLYSKNPDDGWHSFVRPDRYVAKYATHGFQGSPKQIEELIMHNRRKYEVEKPNTLRDSIKRDLVPNKFERRSRVLKVPPLKRAFHYQ